MSSDYFMFRTEETKRYRCHACASDGERLDLQTKGEEVTQRSLAPEERIEILRGISLWAAIPIGGGGKLLESLANKKSRWKRGKVVITRGTGGRSSNVLR